MSMPVRIFSKSFIHEGSTLQLSPARFPIPRGNCLQNYLHCCRTVAFAGRESIVLPFQSLGRNFINACSTIHHVQVADVFVFGVGSPYKIMHVGA